MNNNYPPFYVGQQVVCVEPTIRLKKDNIYTVNECFYCCGIWFVTAMELPSP